MLVNGEGVLFPPLPLVPRGGRASRRVAHDLHKDADLPCEMCGAAVIAAQCKRICPRCGYMAGGTDAR